MDTIQINLEKFKRDNWSEKELSNATLAIDFVQNLMNNHNFDYVLKNFSGGSYIQHNQSMPDGLNGVVDYIQNLTKRFPDYSYDVKHIYADGDFITLHSHATVKRKNRGNAKAGFNIIDTWKIQDGKLVEHWDAIQAISGFWRFYSWLTGGGFKNKNTYF